LPDTSVVSAGRQRGLALSPLFGIFTDLVLADSAGALFTYKAPTNTPDPAAGVMAAVNLAASGLGVQDVLGNCRVFVHGSTIATNTILERMCAVVGLLTTEGFRDSLEIRRGIREDAWDHRSPFPDVLVPRRLRLPILERMDKDGLSLRPPDPDSAKGPMASPHSGSMGAWQDDRDH
jgi:N-methylhydantoinase A